MMLSIVLPVMRWNESDVHDTAGSDRVFMGGGYRLVDGGFPGSRLVPLSAASVVLVATGTRLVDRGAWAWRLVVAAALLLAYYPIWVLYVFLAKLEDGVVPAAGAVALVIGSLAVGVGVWRLGAARHAGRPRELAIE